MKNHQNKLSRALAILMSFAMALSVVFVGNPTEVQAANNKKVASMTVNKDSVKLDLAKTKTATVKVTVNAKKGNKLAKKLFVVKATPKDKSVVKTKIKSQPKGNAKAKKGITKITLTAQKVGKTTITIKAKKNSKVKQVIDVEVIDSSAKPADTQPTQPDQKPADTQPTQPDQKPADTVTTPTAANTEIKLPESIDKTNPVVAINTPVKFDTNQPGLVWKSSNEDVAMITSDGTFFGKKDGKVEVQLVDANGNVIQKMEITVGNGGSGNNDPVYKDIKITTKDTPDGTSPSVTIGNDIQLIPDVPADVAEKIEWVSADSKVAVVSGGTVTGVGVGSTTITAKLDGNTIGTIAVTVKEVAVTGVTVAPKTLSLLEGANATLNATVAPENATVKTVKWASSKEDVATVDGNGKVYAKKAGTARITVTSTVDESVKDFCDVTVTEDTTAGGTELKVVTVDSLKDYPNTYLVGSTGKINVVLTKDGAPLSGEDIDVSVEPVAGYTDFYQDYNSNGASGIISTNNSGVAKYYFSLTSDYAQTKKARITSMDNPEEFAYASFNVTFKYEDENPVSIPISFAQVLAETKYSEHNTAITVDNEHDPALNEIESVEYHDENVKQTVGEKNGNIPGVNQEYVVDQQVSTSKTSHEVVLDAAPTLVLPSTLGAGEQGGYRQDINQSINNYSVYQDDETAITISKVPAGLNRLNLYFSKLQLSKYSKLVVRAYDPETNVPIVTGEEGQEELVQKEFSYTNKLGIGNSLTVEKEIFEKTGGQREIDLKVFIASAGQVNEKSNDGCTVTYVEGIFTNREMKPYSYDFLTGAVTWNLEKISYSTSTDLTDEEARAYLEDSYVETNKYTYQVPTTPRTGNGVIVGTNKASSEKQSYYLYPTVANTEFNTASNINEMIIKQDVDSEYFGASDECVTDLSEINKDKKTDDFGRLILDSKKAGMYQVSANISFGSVNYKVYSSVQYMYVPPKKEYTYKDYYALAGQTISLKVWVRDADDENNVQYPVPEWSGLDEIPDYVTVTPDENKGEKWKGDASGVLNVKITSTKDFSLKDVMAEYDDFPVYFYVGEGSTEAVKADYVNLHWIQPGIYYKNSEDNVTVNDDVIGDDIQEITTLDADNTVVAPESTYAANDEWIIGTKVVGKIGNQIVEIKNIKLDLSASSDDTKINTELKPIANGVVSWTNKVKGEADLLAKINKKLTADYPLFVFEDGTEVFGVGKGNIENGQDLQIPVKWVESGANLQIVNWNPIFNINNDEPALVYLQVLDDYGNPTDSTNVMYKIGESEFSRVTVEDGLYEIEVPSNAATNMMITAYIEDAGANAKVESRILFKETEGDLDINEDSINMDSAKGTITFTMSQSLDPEFVNSDTKDFFEVYDGETRLDVESVSVDENNAKKVTITTVQKGFNTASTYVKLAPSIEIDGMTHYLLDDTNGIMPSLGY